MIALKKIVLSALFLPALAFAKVNINTATVEELSRLKGIGESKAQAIVDYREANGEFASVDDLVKVKGIGEKTLEKLKVDLVLEGETTFDDVENLSK